MRIHHRSDSSSPRQHSASTRLALEALDDRVVPATLAIADVTVLEGASGVQNAAVTVTLSEPLKKPVSVDYGTSNGSATAGNDYAAVSGKLTFAKGETVKAILVPVYGDQVPESTEAFSVRLFEAKGVKIADGQGTVTIVDSSPRLGISPQGGYEGDVMTFTVRLSAALDTAFTVDFATADWPYSDQYPDQPGWADAGLDYVATSGTLTFAPGETTQTFSVQILADDLEEYDEFFFVQLSNPSAPVILPPADWAVTTGWGRIYSEFGTSPV